jgi:hypothetical protein
MHRVFLFMGLLLAGCASDKLAKDDMILDSYTRGYADGIAASRHPRLSRPAPCGIPIATDYR